MKGDLAKLKERYSFYWKRQWKLWQFWAVCKVAGYTNVHF